MPEINNYTLKELRTLDYFRGLNDSLLQDILHLLVVKKLQMGELLLGENKENSSIYFLLSGELRQHIYHPITNKRLTLNLHSCPFVAGLASYHAGFPVEFITAANDCILLSIELSSIEKLRTTYAESSCLLEQNLSTSDLWPIVSTLFKSSVPNTSKALQNWIQNYLYSAHQHWLKNDSWVDFDSISNRSFHLGSNIPGKVYSQRLTHEDIKQLKDLKLDKPIRIFDITSTNPPHYQLRDEKFIQSNLPTDISLSSGSPRTFEEADEINISVPEKYI